MAVIFLPNKSDSTFKRKKANVYLVYTGNEYSEILRQA